MQPPKALPDDESRLPLWLKIATTALVLVVIPTFFAWYGFAHTFLWFSSIALYVVCIALWWEDRLLASMQAVSVVILEFAYTLDLVWKLATGEFLNGLSVYLFQAEDSPWYVRGLSLFHVPLPFVLLYMLWRLGYDWRGFYLQTVFAWLLLPICFVLVSPEENVNWVHGPEEPVEWMPPWGWLVTALVAFPLLIYIPSHWFFQWAFVPGENGEPPAEKQRSARAAVEEP